MESSSTIRARQQNYRRSEDKLIVKYFLVTKDVDHLGGNECWKRLQENRQYNPSGRTWQSLKERFKKYIRPFLRRYDLSPEQLELFNAEQDGRILQRKRMQAKSALDTSSDDISDPDDDEPRAGAKSTEVVPFRQGAAGSSKSSLQRPASETPALDSPRPSSSSRKNDSTNRNRSGTLVKRRTLYRASSPLLPERALFNDSPKRFLPFSDSDSGNDSTLPLSQPPKESNASGKESRKPAEKRRMEEGDLNERIPPSPSEERSPPATIDEAIAPRDSLRENVPARRRVRFQDVRPEESVELSPVIETASRERRRETRNQDESVENLEGVMVGALILTQADDSIANRTRSSDGANATIESPVNSPGMPSQVGSQKRFQKRTKATTLPSREIKQEPRDDSREVVAPRRPDSSTRISTQDMIRNTVSDTQSDESFHSTFQSPLRTESQNEASGSPQRTQKRKNHESSVEAQEASIVKRTRSDPTTSEANGAVHSSTARQDLMLPRIGGLRIPEFPELRNEALVAFLGLIQSTVRKHTAWGPHDNCPGLQEFLYLCKVLRQRVLRAQSGSGEREQDADLIDHHLSDMFDVPFCSRDRKNRSIDTRGVNRHLRDNGDWMTLLNDLNIVHEARELLKNMSVRQSLTAVEGNP